jgi:hypothetical protein
LASDVLLNFSRATPDLLHDETRQQLMGLVHESSHNTVDEILTLIHESRKNDVVRSSVRRVFQEKMRAVSAARDAEVDAEEEGAPVVVVDVVEGAAGDDDSTGSRQSSTGSGRAMEQAEFLGTTAVGGEATEMILEYFGAGNNSNDGAGAGGHNVA